MIRPPSARLCWSAIPLGKDELVRLQAGPAELRGLVPAELEILPGTELAVGLKKRGVFLFDAKTGVRYL